MLSTFWAASNGHPGLKLATRFAGQTGSSFEKQKSLEASTVTAPPQDDRFEKLARQVDEIHESGEMFFDAFHELDVRTSKMMDDQSEILQILRQLAPDRVHSEVSGSPSSSPHARKLNIQL